MMDEAQIYQVTNTHGIQVSPKLSFENNNTGTGRGFRGGTQLEASAQVAGRLFHVGLRKDFRFHKD